MKKEKKKVCWQCLGPQALPQFYLPALVWSSLASSEMLTTYPPPLLLLQKKTSDSGVQSAFRAVFCCFLAL